MKEIDNIKVCHSIFSKAMGLRFHRKITKSAFVFPFDVSQKVALDMFFVHFPIDVVFLDNEKNIIEIKENFKPYGFYNTKNKINIVVELPLGYVSKHKLATGKKLDF